MLQRSKVWGLALLLTLAMLPQAVQGQTTNQMFQKGNAAQTAGKYAEAEAIWRKVILQNPRNAVVYYNLGNALYYQNKLDEAITAYQTCIKLNPQSANAYVGLGNVLSTPWKHEEAISAYRKAIQLDPNNKLAYLLLGMQLANQHKSEEAISAYRKAIQLDPNNKLTYDLLALEQSFHNKSNEVILLHPTLFNKTKDVSAYLELGDILSYQNKLGDALTAYRKAIQLDPKDADLYYKLGDVLREQGKPDEAISAYRIPIQLSPKDANAYYRLGGVLSKQGKLDEAITFYSKAIQLNPKEAYFYTGLGDVLKAQNKLDEAILAYRTSLNTPVDESIHLYRYRSLNDAFAHNGIGLALQAQGDLEGAIQEFQASLKTFPPPENVSGNNLKEAQRLLDLKQNRQPIWIDDTVYLPKNEPKLTIFRGTARIIVPKTDASEIAAGWVVKRQGNTAWIVTNRHVVNDPKIKRQVQKSIQVEFYSELSDKRRPRYNAKILHITPDQAGEIDLAILQIVDDRLSKDIQALTWNINRLQANQRINVIGHPYNKKTWHSAPGKVTSYSSQTEELFIKAPVATGNSGGPVINEQNQVVGLFFGIQNKSRLSKSASQGNTKDGISSDTGEIGLAYRIEVIIAKLRTWKIMN
jgi:protein O-GlcNAc transferase